MTYLTWLMAAALVSIPTGWTARERNAAERITAPTLAAHVRFLADDLLEGRAPGSRGSELALKYIAAQYERLGLKPAGDNGGWLQSFDIVSLSSTVAKPISVKGAKGALTLKPLDESIAAPGQQKPYIEINDAEVVFIGYGITAPEQKWDDFKDVDVRGKVVMVMNNDPEDDPALFAGKTRLYYGRWSYKYEEAARHGAAGVIIIHTEHSAAYPWQVVRTSWTGDKFELPANGQPEVQVKMWATEDASRAIAKLGGQDLDELRRRAEKRDFRPVPLGVKLSVAVKTKLSKLRTANVVGLLPGADPKLAREQVVFSAHHDHLGMHPDMKGDNIFNGALDNASGVSALLNVADALAHATPRPRRSVLFAAVAAEESGLLGSQYFCEHPLVAPGLIAANINVDEINVWGRTSDVGYIGLGKSSIDDILVPAARAQGRVVRPDDEPDKGGFYRSDQFNFAKIGVPALYLKPGVRYPGHDEKWGRERQESFTKSRYHQPSDQIDESWNLDGAVDDVRLLTVVALRIADAPKMQAWKPGDEFEAARKKALEAAPR